VLVAWQRGKTAAPIRALIDALGLKSRTSSLAIENIFHENFFEHITVG
jgi:hypothetical protein